MKGKVYIFSTYFCCIVSYCQCILNKIVSLLGKQNREQYVPGEKDNILLSTPWTTFMGAPEYMRTLERYNGSCSRNMRAPEGMTSFNTMRGLEERGAIWSTVRAGRCVIESSIVVR